MAFVDQWIDRLTTDQKVVGSNPPKRAFLRKMALDLIAWMPEMQLCTALLALLFYGTGPAVKAVHEVWWTPSCRVVFQNEQQTPERISVSSTPDGGPGAVTAHLSIWAAIWCLLGAFLIFFTPFPALQTGGAFMRDSFTTMLSAFLLFYSFITIFLATDWYQRAKVVHTEYAVLVCLSIFGMHLLLCSTDLISVYLCLELQSFRIVVLCSLNYKSAYAVEAGMKYFLLSALSSCLFLLGVGLVYWDTGLTKITHLLELFSTLSTQYTVSSMLGVWLISLGLLWKLRRAPLHFWAADVYMGAWSSVTLLISTLPKIAVLGFWVHHWHLLWTTLFGNTLFWFSLRSLLIGAVAPLAQVLLKRLIRFSSIGHIGFMLMPLVGGSEGYASLWVYLIFYCFTSVVVWGLLLWPLNRQMIQNRGPQYLWDLSGLNSALPAARTAWAIAMLSLAGLPPAAGFLGKLGLFWCRLNSHQYRLVVFALLATLLSSVYYLRVLKVSYIENPKGWGVFEAFSPITAYCVAASASTLLRGLWYRAPFVLWAHILTLYASVI